MLWNAATTVWRLMFVIAVLGALGLYAWSMYAHRQEERRAQIAAQERRLMAEEARLLSEQRKIEREAERQFVAQQRAAADASRLREKREREEAQRLARTKREAVAAEKRAERARQAELRQEQQRVDESAAREAEARTAACARQVQDMRKVLQSRRRFPVTTAQDVERAFNAGGAEALIDGLQMALTRYAPAAPVEQGFLQEAHFDPTARELVVQYQLPGRDVVPEAESYRYVKRAGSVQAVQRSRVSCGELYADYVARIALARTRELFEATPHTLVDKVALICHVESVSPTTGRPVNPCLISVTGDRETLDDINLDASELDPAECLRGVLNAVVSPHPWDLEPVRPILQFDLSKFKLIPDVGGVAGLDSRMNLLDLSPSTFEALVRELFEQRGLTAWRTQVSRDDGVDAVAYNEDPILGGLCVIQAKRYSRIVGLEAVHALAGVMNDKSAGKGILVTTSWVGQASVDFAQRNGRMEIIQGRHLKYLLQQFLGLDVIIPLERVPPGWSKADIS